MAWLKQKNTTNIVLLYQPSNHYNISDRYTGKERWIIEASQKDVSNRWESSLDIVGKPPETRIWRVTYNMISPAESPLPVSIGSLEEMRQELSTALVEIHDFAKENKENYFADLFSKSLA